GGSGEIEGVVAAVSRTTVKTHAVQRLGELRIFLAAIGTNHDYACSRSYLRNAIIAHRGRPVIRTREGFRAWRIGMILANDWFNAGLCLHYSTLQQLVRPGSPRQYESGRPIRSPRLRDRRQGND